MHGKPGRKPRLKATPEITVTPSSGNVFADLGYADADTMLIKTDMAIRIESIISARRLTQKQAAALLGIDQPGVSDLINGHLRRYSTDRLIRFLNALGQDVEFVITDRALRSQRPGRLRVRAAAPRAAAVALRLRPGAARVTRKPARTATATVRAQAGGRNA